jgi:hypothetical protein
VVANPIPVDETRSLAYRQNGKVRLLVHLNDPEIAAGEVTVRFRHGERRFRSSATVTTAQGGATLQLGVAARRLGRVPWFIAVQTEGGRFVRVQTRVLAHPGLPVALLPGPPPRTRMPPPVPRSGPAATARGVLRRSRRRVGGLKRRLLGGTGA